METAEKTIGEFTLRKHNTNEPSVENPADTTTQTTETQTENAEDHGKEVQTEEEVSIEATETAVNWEQEAGTWKTKATEWETKHNSLNDEITGYKTKIEELSKPGNPYDGEDALNFYRLQEVGKKSKDDAALYKELLFGNPDDAKLWKLNFIKDNPEFKDQPEKVQRMLERKFPNLFSMDADRESQEYQDDLLDLQLEGKKIKRGFLAELEKITPPESESKETREARVKTEREALTKTWKGDFDKWVNNDLKVTVEVQDGKDKVPFEVQIPNDKKEEYLRRAVVYVLQENLPNNAESVGKVQDFIWRQYKADNFDTELSRMVTDAFKKRDEQWTKKTGGKSPTKTAGADASATFDAQTDFLTKFKQKAQKH